MVDLKAKPYMLTEDDCRWVRDTIAAMTDEEKVGQLFWAILPNDSVESIQNMLNTYHVGGFRFNAAPAEKIAAFCVNVQKYSKIPQLIAVNTESGGDSVCKEGHYIGSGAKIGATRNAEYAYELGRISNTEAAALGCNMAFAPVADILYNWENTEVILRSFGNDPERVAEMSSAYMKGAHTITGFACAAKHFPGNGYDFRDAHLSNNVNSMLPDEWDETYGMVYRRLFSEGMEAVMAGHIMLPVYAKSINPSLTGGEMMPATLSKEIMTGLLRDRMGFNGLAITDASHMVGMTNRMKRSEMLPLAINAGCDMLLFFNDPAEDYAIMLDAYRSGVISEERMTEALTRILGTKAHMGLHKKTAEQLQPDREKLAAVLADDCGNQIQKKISEDGITLVKYKDDGVLPITPEKYPRITLVHVKGNEDGMSAFKKALGLAGMDPTLRLKEKLEAKGFKVTIYENPMDVMLRDVKAGKKPNFNVMFAGKDSIADFLSDKDLVITVCDVASGRPAFGLTKGGGEIPWYVFEIPVIVLGCEQPTMLADMPQARTYINLYDTKEPTLDVLVEKLMTGPDAFKGKDPIDSYCGMADTYL